MYFIYFLYGKCSTGTLSCFLLFYTFRRGSILFNARKAWKYQSGNQPKMTYNTLARRKITKG
jgi:hypothetical protein